MGGVRHSHAPQKGLYYPNHLGIPGELQKIVIHYKETETVKETETETEIYVQAYRESYIEA